MRCLLPFLCLEPGGFLSRAWTFLIDRWCSVKVDAFSLGFGPEIFGFDIVTELIGDWRPCLSAAMSNSRRRQRRLDDRRGRRGGPYLRSGGKFRFAVWKRAAIVARARCQTHLAIVIFTGIFFVNGRAIAFAEGGWRHCWQLRRGAGFQPGDLIVSIDGTKVDSFEEMQRIVQTASDAELVLPSSAAAN
jgi:regulator of sigma E protease